MKSANGTGRPTNILHIEDDPDTAATVALLLDNNNYEVTVATTGAEALARLKQQPYSLVLLDLMLPDIDGYKICQSVKNREPLLPVVVLSARSDIRDKVRALDVGADDYITKPFRRTELLARVKAALRTRANLILLAQYSQQLQLVTDIGHRVSSILDLDTLVWESIRVAQRAFDLGCFGVGLQEGADLLWRLGLRVDGSGIVERVVKVSVGRVDPRNQMANLEATELASASRSMLDGLVAAEPSAFRSKMTVPIYHGGKVFGALLAGSEQPERFQAQDRLILGTLAGQLGAAVDNARLAMAQRREIFVATTLVQVAQLSKHLRPIGEIARATVALVTRLSGVDHSAIGFWQHEGGRIVQTALFADGPEAEEALRELAPPGEFSLLEMVLQAKEPLVLPGDQWRRGAAGENLADDRIGELLAMPIGCGEPTLGALWIFGEPAHHFDAYDRSLAAGIARQIALATEDARFASHARLDQGPLQAVLSSMQDGVFLVDETGRIIYCNPRLREVVGGHVESLLGHSYHALFQQVAASSGNEEKTRQDLAAALERLPTFPIVDITLPRPEPVHFQFGFFPVRDGAQGEIGWGGVARDVTHERERLNFVSELLSDLSHELRSPLAAIKGFVSMLSGDRAYRDEEGRQSFLESINESADQLGRLIESILEMSHLDAGVARLQRRTVSLGALIQRTAQAARFVGKEHEIEVFIADDLPEVEVDPLRIEQVLRNLLENAVKFSPRGGKIVVRAERQQDESLISVSDQGIGVAEQYLARIFDRFYQVNSLSAGQSSGVGLGLYICRELVAAHGGRIWASSKPGQGTTIYFTLPIEHTVSQIPSAARLDLEPHARPPTQTASALWEATTILVVEDDPQMLRFLKAILEAEGYKMLAASRGRAALERVAHQPIDLVLLDLMLPDLDGFQVCERLREFSAVPIIMVTARAEEHDQLHGLNIGADDYLEKPFSQKELLARVRAVLRRASASDPTAQQPVQRFDDLTLDFARRQVWLRGSQVHVGRHEYKVLHRLAAEPGRVFTHSQLLEAAWGSEYTDATNYLWVTISRLRKKLEDDSSHPKYILTEPGVGYRFREN